MTLAGLRVVHGFHHHGLAQPESLPKRLPDAHVHTLRGGQPRPGAALGGPDGLAQPVHDRLVVVGVERDAQVGGDDAGVGRERLGVGA